MLSRDHSYNKSEAIKLLLMELAVIKYIIDIMWACSILHYQ